MKKSLIMFGILCGLVVIGLAFIGPLFAKLFVGQARILFGTPCQVKINGESDSRKICFYADKYFHGGAADLIVIYDLDESDGYHPVMIVNRTKGDAGLPNASTDDYRALGGFFLLQSESGSMIVPYESAKFGYGDPGYEFRNGYVKFTRPAGSNGQMEVFELLTDPQFK